jgi:cbb3-type cytochrome oxidase subunit 1
LFTITGLLALFLSASWIVAQPEILAMYHYSPGAIALTHLFVLGWLCSIVMGAMYQLVPVALETKLFSERLAQIQFAFHITGCVGMVWAFQVWNLKSVAQFGAVLAVGVALFIYNLARTLLRVPKWNVVATSVASAIVWVLLAVAVGLVIAVAKSFSESLPALAGFVFRFDPIGAMHAHAHLGAIGFFLVLIVGVSYKLIPMFTLSELQNHRRAAWSVILLNAGLAGSFVTILLRSPWKLAFALVVISALALYTLELRAILRARKRASLDWGVRYFLTAVGFMFPLSIIAAVLSWPGLPVNAYTMQLENVYGFLGLVGVVSFAIMGMLYKIIPFLVWFGTYSRHIGRAQVPVLAEMYSARLQVIGYWIFLAGLLTTLVAMEFSNPVAVRWGGGLLVASLAVFGFNVAKMLRHFVRPQLKPLAKISVIRTAL